MTITIRRATLEDKQAIFAFLNQAYGDKARYKYPERWEWQFENNPFRDPDALPLWIALNETGNIVGQIGSQIEPLKQGPNLKRRLFWGVDLVVLPEYRNQKIGNKLNQAMVSNTENIIALPMSGAYRHYLLELGATKVDAAQAFQKYLYLDATAIKSTLSNRLADSASFRLFLKALFGLRFDRLISKVANLFLKHQNAPNRSLHFPNISIVEVKEFDSSTDRFWASVADEFEIIVERTSQFLNWKYVQQPFLQYRKFLAFRNGAVSGYIILRRSDSLEGDFGIIADLLSSPSDTESINALLEHTLSWFYQQKVKIVFAASSHPVFQRALTHFKFSKYKEVIPLFKNFDSSYELEQAYESGNWFFGRSDHDWDQYPYG